MAQSIDELMEQKLRKGEKLTDLNVGQRVYIAALVLKEHPEFTNDEASKIVDANSRYIGFAKQLIDHGTPEEQEMVRNGEISPWVIVKTRYQVKSRKLPPGNDRELRPAKLKSKKTEAALRSEIGALLDIRAKAVVLHDLDVNNLEARFQATTIRNAAEQKIGQLLTEDTEEKLLFGRVWLSQFRVTRQQLRQWRTVAARNLPDRPTLRTSGMPIKTADGSHPFEYVRKAMDDMEGKIGNVEIARKIKMNPRLYLETRDLCRLYDMRKDLTKTDQEIVETAVADFNIKRQISGIHRTILPIIRKVFGHARHDVATKRKIEAFDNGINSIEMVCFRAAEMSIPYLRTEALTTAIDDMEGAKTNLSQLIARLKATLKERVSAT